MKKLTSTKHLHFLWVTAILVTLFFSACTMGRTQGTASNRDTTSATQPVTVTTQPTQSSILNRPVTYVALGASDAVGVGSNSPGSQGYVPLIAARLAKGSHLINLGISGIRLHEAISKELPLAIATSPDLVTIWLVAN